MAVRLSKEDRRKISATLEREEEAKREQMKARDQRELRKLSTQTRVMKQMKLTDTAAEKQAIVKNILIKEKSSLESNLKLMRSKRRCILDFKKERDISNLFAQGDDLDAAIEKEKKYIADLESQIHKDAMNIHKLKRTKGAGVSTRSEYLTKKENERADRTLESWKSRLDAEQTQLSLVVKENAEMREKLKRLLMEKGQFNKLFGELMGKLTRGKVIMKDVVERSRQQFQKKDEINRKIEALKSKDKADWVKRVEEMQELQIKLFDDKHLVDFRHRVQMLREKLEEERPSTKDEMHNKELLARLDIANDCWASIQEATGQKSCEEICKHIVSEDSNLFTLFTFNNETRDQLEVMTWKISKLILQVNEESDAAEADIQEKIKIKNTKVKRLEILEQNMNDYHDMCEANARLLARLLDKIKFLVDLMKCNTSTLKELLGENTKVTEYNYRLFLNLIESEVIFILNTMNDQGVILTGFNLGPSKSKSDKSLSFMKPYQHSETKVFPLGKRVLSRLCLDCDRAKKMQ